MFYQLVTGKNEGNLTYQVFTDFFTVVSATIPDDDYFEMYIQNTFGLLYQNPRKNVYAGGGGGRDTQVDFQNGYIKDFHRNFHQGGTVA